MLDLRHKMLIGDALHTQRRFSIQIVTAGGDYLWTIKANQPDTMATIAHLFEPEPISPGFAPTPTDFKTVTWLTDRFNLEKGQEVSKQVASH